MDMKTQVCSSTSSDGCYNDEDYIICPYCKVFEKTTAEVALLGTYVKGEGTYDTDPTDPMMYIGSNTAALRRSRQWRCSGTAGTMRGRSWWIPVMLILWWWWMGKRIVSIWPIFTPP